MFDASNLHYGKLNYDMLQKNPMWIHRYNHDTTKFSRGLEKSVHQQIAKIITKHHPDSWLALFPAPLPHVQTPDMKKLIHARHMENLVEARRIHEEVNTSLIPRASLFATPESSKPKPLTDHELAALAECDFKKRQSESR